MKEEEEEMEVGVPVQPALWVLSYLSVCGHKQVSQSPEGKVMTYLLRDGGNSFPLCSAVTAFFIFHLISHQNRHPRREMDVTSGSKCSRSIGTRRNCGRGAFVSDRGDLSITLGAAVAQH